MDGRDATVDGTRIFLPEPRADRPLTPVEHLAVPASGSGVRLGLFRIDAAGLVTEVSLGWVQITGSEPTGRVPLWILGVHPEDSARVEAAWRDAVRSGGVLDVAFRLSPPDERWVTLHAEPAFDATAQATGFTGAILDLSQVLEAQRDAARVTAALRTLSRCNEILIHAEDVGGLLQQMCDAIVAGGYVFVWVGFAERDAARTVRPAAWAGHDGDDYLSRTTITWDAEAPSGRGPTGTAIRTGRHQVVDDTMTDPQYGPWRRLAKAHGYRSSVALPLAVGGEIVGALSIYADDPHAFNEQTLALLDEFADDLAFGIVTLRTREERSDYFERLEHSMERTVGAVASVVELRDPYTAGHQRRVAELAAQIAHELGLDHDARAISLAGSLHDIGKIIVPAEILAKPAALRPAEFAVVKEHAAVGANLLAGIDFPWPLADMVGQHHERLDGSGYPKGLSGDAVIVPARIIAVADVVEAMSSHRPYRPALGLDAALDEIRRGSGRLYDPSAVEACLGLFEHGYSFSGSDRWTEPYGAAKA